MSVEIYHLHFAQSDRIVWFCEELKAVVPSFKYELFAFPRGMADSEGKQKLLSLFPTGTAPTMVDKTVSPAIHMSESQAILTYLINVHGAGHFQVTPSAGPHAYSQYLFWLNFANASLQAFLSVDLTASALIRQAGDAIDPAQNMVYQSMSMRTPMHLKMYNDRLGESKYLAGDDEVTAADFMSVYAFTTFRPVYPYYLTEYPNITRWLKDVTGRPGYRSAMEKAEDGLPPLIKPVLPEISIETLLSLKSWREDPALVSLSEE